MNCLPQGYTFRDAVNNSLQYKREPTLPHVFASVSIYCRHRKLSLFCHRCGGKCKVVPVLHRTPQYDESRGRARNYMLVNSTGSRPGQLTPGRVPGPRGRSGLLEENYGESQSSHYADWAIAVRTEGQDWEKIWENFRAIIVLAAMLKSSRVRLCCPSTDCSQLMQHFVC